MIAEVGHNHQGDIKKAFEHFRVAKLSGAQAVKLQKRDNKSLYTKAFYNKSYENYFTKYFYNIYIEQTFCVKALNYKKSLLLAAKYFVNDKKLLR